MSAAAAAGALERSRRRVLDAVGSAADPVLVSVADGPAGALALAGARALLASLAPREVDAAALAGDGGELALLVGADDRGRGGRLARALGVAAQRFERLVVLPSTFHAHDDALLDALAGSAATAFAGDPLSLAAIADRCDARRAHDCVLYADYGGPHGEGAGALDARGDALDALDLPAWLGALASHELIRADRVPVLIAAARLGRRVEYPAGADGRLEWTASHPLAGDRVAAVGDPALTTPARPAAAPLDPAALETLHRLEAAARAQPPPRGAGAARVTAIVLTRDRPAFVRRALDSLAGAAQPPDVLVIDNASAPAGARALAVECAARPGTTLQRSERNLGCAGGRRLGVERSVGELVLFLDDDAELLPGALEHLVGDLDAHPDAGAVAATVVTPDGLISHSGGSFAVSGGVAWFALTGSGRPFTATALPPTGPADWVPGTATLVRRSLLEAFPLDERMAAYYEDNEWCYRVSRGRAGAFRRSREALALHHLTPKRPDGPSFDARSLAVELLAAQARFHDRHGLLLAPWLFHLVPELTARDGTRDLAGARVLMDLVSARGTDWTFAALMRGDLDGLLQAHARDVELSTVRLLEERARSDRDATLRALGAMRERLAHAADELERAHGQVAWLERYSAGQDEQIAWLRQRSETLTAIEEGGWWRLRGRLLPLLRVAARLRGRR